MRRPKSSKARKQRKFQAEAPLHNRRKMMAAHLSDELRKRHQVRAVPLRKGDEVVVMRGDFRKKAGKVARVDSAKYKVYVEGLMIKKTDGTERQVGLHPSNLLITKLALEDKMRNVGKAPAAKEEDKK
jgi:large subunit ribosomal protein L24